jgi:hypothetical protein
MNNNKKSLIANLVGKGVVNAYEAIHIQHLNNQHVRQQMPDVQAWNNLYLAVENVPTLLSPGQIKLLLSFQNQQDGELYEAYRWAASYLSHLDSNIGDVLYKAIALQNELRYMRDENVLRIITDNQMGKPITGTLHDYVGYSYVHQKRMKFSDIVESFALNFKLLAMSIDNIFTLNYYLNGLYALEDLRCLQYLEMLLIEDKPLTSEQAEDMNPIFNASRLCMEQTFHFIIDRNHSEFVELMKNKLSPHGVMLQASFEGESLQIVKDTVTDIANAYGITLNKEPIMPEGAKT